MVCCIYKGKSGAQGRTQPSTSVSKGSNSLRQSTRGTTEAAARVACDLSAAAAKKSGHKEDGASWGRGSSPPWVSEPRAGREMMHPWQLCAAAWPSAARLPPKEGAWAFSELLQRGAEDSSPSLAIPVFSPAQRRGTLPIPLKAWGHALLSERSGFGHRAQLPRGAPLENPLRADRIDGKIGLELLVCTLGKGTASP